MQTIEGAAAAVDAVPSTNGPARDAGQGAKLIQVQGTTGGAGSVNPRLYVSVDTATSPPALRLVVVGTGRQPNLPLAPSGGKSGSAP